MTFKKALSLAMILMMVVSTMVILPLTASAEDVVVGPIEGEAPVGYASGDPLSGSVGQSSSNPYIISKPEHLVYLGQYTLRSGFYALANDIDMAGVTNFHSMKADANTSFTFDGKGYAIKNLTVNDGIGGAWVAGLFGMSRGNDVIKNLKMENLCVDNTWTDASTVVATGSYNNNTYIGGLVGQANEGSTLTIENVTIDANSVIKTGNVYNAAGGTTKQDTQVGGFIGVVTGAKTITIKNCENYASIDGNTGSTTSSRTGGFIGKHDQAANLTFENCTFGGAEIRGVHAGGFIGNFGGAATVTFKNCTTNTAMVGNQAGTVGGYIAYVNNASAHLVAENCVATVPSGKTYYCGNASCKMGGFYGWLNGCGSATFTDCVSAIGEMANQGQSGGFVGRTNKPGLTFTRCVNKSFVAAYGSWEAGGFCGYLDNTDSSNAKTIKFEDCLNRGGVYGKATVGGFIGTLNGNLNVDMDYCGNTANLTTSNTSNSSAYGADAMGGMIGAVLNGTGGNSITMDNCYNTSPKMKVSAPAGSYSGFGGLIGTLHQHTKTGNTVAFTNCYVNATVESSNTMGDYYGKRSNGDDYTLVTTTDCAVGADAAAGIVAVDKVLFADTVDISRESAKLSIRLRVTDDFGFMAILSQNDFEQALPVTYGFCFSTKEITDVDKTTKVAAAAYGNKSNVVQAAYTDLTVATLGTPIYFAVYVEFNGTACLASEVRSINCLDMVAELRDGMMGDAVVTKNPYEMVLYSEMVAYYAAYHEFADTSEEVVIPPIASSGLLADIPAFHAVPTKTLDSGNNCKLVIFNDATVTNFNNYCAALEAAGFEKYSESTFNGGNMGANAGKEDYYLGTSYTLNHENYFATYVSNDRTIDLAFHEYDDIMYVSVSPTRAGLVLPNNEPVEVENPLPITITQIGTADLHDEGDMVYVIRLADGTFIIYDGGLSYESRGYVADEIVKVLKKQAADPENIVISAFILTHPHSDHTTGFVQFANRYAGTTGIKLKQVVYNFPDATQIKVGTTYDSLIKTQNAIKKFGSDVEVIKPRSGNVLHYAGVKFNVLYTQEDYLSLSDGFYIVNSDGTYADAANASSLVTQMVTNDGTKVLFGGDHWADQCQGQLKYRYGTFLESYVVTLFHHGQGGGAEDNSIMGEKTGSLLLGGYYTGWKYSIYALAIHPKVVLWPNAWAKINSTDPTQDDVPRNLYFTKTGSNMNKDFTAGKDKLSTTANNQGVYGYLVADDGIQILTINGLNSVSAATYATRADYYKSK